jgi:hypothetical protein
MVLKRFSLLYVAAAVLFLALAPIGCASSGDSRPEAAVERIGPEEARAMVQSGEALLVCAYRDGTCHSRMLEGAILRSELETRLPTLPMDQKIVFYCG